MTDAQDAAAPELPPMDAELQGYAWMPRMLSKARGTIANDGRPDFGCPVDHSLMARLGVEPALVLELVERHDRDEDVLAALREHGIPPAEEAWFDAQALEDEIQDTGNYLRVRASERLPELNGGRAFAGSEHGAPVSLVLLDAEPGGVQPAHSHELPEVIVVQEGQVTVYLGDLQQRILRPGQVARVPAGMPHRLVNCGDGPLRAICVQAGGEVEVQVP